jgi:hypothetical protein
MQSNGPIPRRSKVKSRWERTCARQPTPPGGAQVVSPLAQPQRPRLLAALREAIS